MAFEPNNPPGPACSYAELQVAEQLGSLLTESGRTVEWRAVWLRRSMELLAACVAIAATGLGLLALKAPAAAGIALAALLALWTLEAAGLPSPLREFCPQRATQDAVATDPRSSASSETCLLLVRADLQPAKPKHVGCLLTHINITTWLVVAATLAAASARALSLNEQFVGAVQLLPALASLGLLAAVVLTRGDRLEPPSEGWTGIDQALSAVAQLEKQDSQRTNYSLEVVGASSMNGAARVLKADRNATAACRCWEYDSGDAVVSALAAP